MQRVTWHLPDLGEVHTEKNDHEVEEFVHALRALGFTPEVSPC